MALRVSIDAGASSINISLPRSVGVKLEVDGALTSRNFQDFEMLDGDTWQSRNYDSAVKKIEIDIDAGVSSLNVGWR